MTRLAVDGVVSFSVEKDGDDIVFSFDDGAEFVTEYRGVPNIISQLQDAVTAAYQARRKANKLDLPENVRPVPILKGARYGLSQEGKVLVLQLDVSTGQIDIALSKTAVQGFVDTLTLALAEMDETAWTRN